jgi:dTDP-4-amino-4,6-dideoxygalactose transaminase
MTEAEVKEVREAILSGWITTGPRTTYIPASIHNEAMLSGAWTSIAQ